MTRATTKAAIHTAPRFPATVVALAAGLACATAAGQSAPAVARPRMLDNGAAIGVKDCVTTAAQALADEDLDAFVGCFASGRQPGIRRKAAMLFVTHAIDLELIDSHILTEADAKAELAVRYRATLSDEAWDIVSVIGLVKEDGAWRIAREKVESKTRCARGSSASCADNRVFRGGGAAILDLDGAAGRPRGGCANGRCGL